MDTEGISTGSPGACPPRSHPRFRARSEGGVLRGWPRSGSTNASAPNSGRSGPEFPNRGVGGIASWTQKRGPGCPGCETIDTSAKGNTVSQGAGLGWIGGDMAVRYVPLDLRMDDRFIRGTKFERERNADGSRRHVRTAAWLEPSKEARR
eukprot:scaffold121_cov356-Pavlova_lutheri.AAC.23